MPIFASSTQNGCSSCNDHEQDPFSIKALPRYFFMAPGRKASAENVAESINTATGFQSTTFSPGFFPIVVTTENSPIFFQVQENIEGIISIYQYWFIGGAGSWGYHGEYLEHLNLRLLSVRALNVADIEGDPNTVTANLGTIADGNFIIVANASEHDFSDADKAYYFVYVTDGVSYTQRFIGMPGIYGGGNPAFSSAMFATGPTSETPPVVIPTLSEVNAAGNITPRKINILTGVDDANVKGLKVGNYLPTDPWNMAAITQEYTIDGVRNGLNVEMRGIGAANAANRVVRAGKFVGLINPNGYYISDAGGGSIGVEGVSRFIAGGTGQIMAMTGGYFRVLNDSADPAASILNANGVVVPGCSSAGSPIVRANGIVISEQGDTSQTANSANLVVGSPFANVGNMNGVYTGRYNIFAPGANPNYFKSNTGFNKINPTEAVDIVGNAAVSLAPTLAAHLTRKDYVDAALALKANDLAVMHLATAETVLGTKTFSATQIFATLVANVIRASSSGLYFQNNAGSSLFGQFFNGTGNLALQTGGTLSDDGNKLQVTGNIKLSGVFNYGQFTTAAAPAYVKGGSYFDTTLNKLRIAGATGWETITSS